jgi:phage terminase small subunit
MPELKNYRHEQFAQEFVKTNNAAHSYRCAGYQAPSENALRVSAHHLLTKPNMQFRISEIRRQLARKTPMTKEVAIEDLTAMAQHGESDSIKLQAYSQIGKWLGWDQPTRVVVSTDPLLAYMQEIRSMPIEPRQGLQLAREREQLAIECDSNREEALMNNGLRVDGTTS